MVGVSLFFPTLFGIFRFVRLGEHFFLRYLDKNGSNSEQKQAAATVWLQIRKAVQFGQPFSQLTVPPAFIVTIRGLALDLLATTSVLSTLFEKHGPFPMAP